ncbi:hypothetical protein MAR_021456 [Mya arenaria]|uniref:Uncharacterized protein n=1 Tax=Mya arenaria TaxID=6604 RepID=A0ABY7EBC0_MYAAR|nr:hypothetical protein MAR_021456 [Mya arenaria]
MYNTLTEVSKKGIYATMNWWYAVCGVILSCHPSVASSSCPIKHRWTGKSETVGEHRFCLICLS